MTSDVEMVKRSIAAAILDNGEEIAITNWLDDHGEECLPDAAVVAVAGPDIGGHWYTIDLSEFEPVSLD